jgi:hypothetical protein
VHWPVTSPEGTRAGASARALASPLGYYGDLVNLLLGTVLGLPVLVAGILDLLLGDLGAENFLMRVELRRTLAACLAAQFNRLTPAAGDLPYYEQ